MAVDTAALAERDAWRATLTARDDHAARCCGDEDAPCDEAVRLKQCETNAWNVYFEARFPTNRSERVTP